ncbi:hypothetical protein D3C81_2244260 [compost metagenome]
MGQAVFVDIFEPLLRGDDVGNPVGGRAGSPKGNNNFFWRFQDEAEPFPDVSDRFGLNGIFQRIIKRHHE